MLRRVACSLMVTLMIAAAGEHAWADASCSMFSSRCTVEGSVTETRPRPASKPESRSSRTGSGPRTCSFQGEPVACQSRNGTWYDHVNAWCSPADPQPPKSDEIWEGRTEGVVHMCTRPGVNGLPAGVWDRLFPPGTAPQAPPPPDPVVVAKRLVASVGLQGIEPGTTPTTIERNPEAQGAVGLPLWVWPENPGPTTTGPVSSATPVAAYTVSIRGELAELEVDLGDGSEPLHCTRWKPFRPKVMDRDTPIACGKRYGYEKQGYHTITVTAHWRIRWQGVGRAGELTHAVSTSRTLKIGELHAVSVPNPTGRRR